MNRDGTLCHHLILLQGWKLRITLRHSGGGGNSMLWWCKMSNFWQILIHTSGIREPCHFNNGWAKSPEMFSIDSTGLEIQIKAVWWNHTTRGLLVSYCYLFFCRSSWLFLICSACRRSFAVGSYGFHFRAACNRISFRYCCKALKTLPWLYTKRPARRCMRLILLY